ncbi:MAG: ArsR/SmtB family transcription factor [Flavobacteriaceae bacterium]
MLARDTDIIAERAEEAAALLRLLANGNRLRILCHLIDAGELPVNALAARVGLSQSALSQHLARLREQGLVATRRDAQTIHYRVPESDALTILQALKQVYCP